MSVLGLDSGYKVKYNPLLSGVPPGFALGNSFRLPRLVPIRLQDVQTIWNIWNIIIETHMQEDDTRLVKLSCIRTALSFNCYILLKNFFLLSVGHYVPGNKAMLLIYIWKNIVIFSYFSLTLSVQIF